MTITPTRRGYRSAARNIIGGEVNGCARYNVPERPRRPPP